MPCKRTDCGAWANSIPYVAAANPDISGIGILVSFGASAYFTLMFCMAYYLIDDNASTRLVECSDVEEGEELLRYKTNMVDEIFRRKVAALLSNTGNLYSKRWSEAFQSAVLLYSDQQSLTGIAVLVSGVSQLGCSLATYHWQLTFDMAWFSSITHLTTLTCLRHYFQKRPALRAWRLLYMAVTAVMLAASLGSTGFIGRYTDPSFPALCLFRPEDVKRSGNNGSYNGWYIAIALGFLMISYVTRIVQLFPGVTDVVNDYFRARPRDKFQRWLDAVRDRANRSSSSLSKIKWAVLFTFICSLWCLIEAMAEMWSSLLWEITWLLIALVWGTLRIVEDRMGGRYGDTGGIDVSEDDLWGFGQVVAIMLLISPFVTYFGVSYEALMRSTGSLTAAKKVLPTRLSSDATNGRTFQDMRSTNENTAIDRHSQSIEFPRLRLTGRNTDANQHQAIRTLAGEDNSAALQDAHHTIAGENSDQQHHQEAVALPTQQRPEFYKYRWFRVLILMVYCLSLAVAGIVLATFLVLGAIDVLKETGLKLMKRYAKWLAINFVALWAFAIIGVISTTQDIPMPRPRWMTRIREELGPSHAPVEGSLSPADIALVEKIAWTVFVC